MAGPWDNVDYGGYLAATRTPPEMHGLDGWCDVLGIEYVDLLGQGGGTRQEQSWKYTNQMEQRKHKQDKINIANIFDEIIARINANSYIVRIDGGYRMDKGIRDYLTNMHPINGERKKWDPNFNVKDDNMDGGIMNRDLYSYQGIQQLLIEQDYSWDYTNPPQNSIIYQYLPKGDGGGSINLNYISKIYDSDTGKSFMDADDVDLDSTINWVWMQRKYTTQFRKLVLSRWVATGIEFKDWNSCDPWIQGTGMNISKTLLGFISLSQDKGGFFINWPTKPPQIGSV